jgi:hypothetical protein
MECVHARTIGQGRNAGGLAGDLAVHAPERLVAETFRGTATLTSDPA